MLYGIWMARIKHRLAQAVWRLSDKVSNPSLDFVQRWLDKVGDALITSAAEQATRAVTKRLRKRK
jgi:hypothetical protein